MSARPALTVVVPVYHNAESLPELHRRLVALESRLGVRMTVQYVDDRSRDDSYPTLLRLSAADPRAKVLRLSRNCGSITAIRAGIDQAADADVVAVLSADLQDPPERLEPMTQAWREGTPVVLAVRAKRRDALGTRLLSAIAYALLRRVALPEMPAGGFDFFLIDRRVADALRLLPERHSSLVGLLLWLGFERAEIPYERGKRPFGRSMWTLARRVRYFVDTVIAFSPTPLRLATYAGGLTLLTTAVGFVGGVLGVTAPAPMLLAVGAIGGLQLVGLGVLGEYLWRVLEETRRRPLYVVDRESRPIASDRVRAAG